MTALIPLFIQLLPQLIKAGEAGVAFVQNFRSAAKQTLAWTAEHEAQYQATLSEANNLPESRTDAEIKGS